MTQITTGRCLCGDVSFQISGAFELFFLCHCSRCRKGSGSAHAANLFATTAELNWLSGQDQVQTFRLPETRHQRSFCTTCGSPLPTSVKGLLVVPAGSLDTPVTLRPTAHICLSSRADWEDGLEHAPRLEGMPG